MDPFKIDVPPFHVCDQLHADGVPTSTPSKPETNLLQRVDGRWHTCLVCGPGTIASNVPRSLTPAACSGRFPPAVHLCWHVFLSVQCRASSPAPRPIRTGPPAIAALTIPLGDQIGEKRGFGAVAMSIISYASQVGWASPRGIRRHTRRPSV